MIILKKALPRRTFLRGVGATLALPLLDAMVPAMTPLKATPATPVRRLGFVFIPMGCDITRWTPAGKDTLGDLPPILSPLKAVKDHITVVTNTELQNAYPATHSSSNAAFLSCAVSKHTESTDYRLGTTVDQIAAKQLGRETQLPSLELAMDMLQTVGQCDNGYACVYQNNLSWSSPTTPLPAEAHPRLVFESLFGEGGSRADREAGVSDPHHPLSHHGNDAAKVAKMAKINQFHVSLFAEFIGKLKATKEGSGTLLDHSVILYGSGMGNPNLHDHTNLPILVAGGAACGLKGGRHIRFEKAAPLANLHLTLLDKVGVRIDKFADSSGKVDGLFSL